jgi:ChrB-like protein
MRVEQWLVLVYRIPSEPASKRVAIWRDLKRTGALYLQQCVCILPDLGNNAEELERVMAKVTTVGGETVRFLVPRLDSGDEARIIAGFIAQRTSEYAEIIEECDTKFQKEIEFEHFRQNYTFEEVEEIEQDLDKIRHWYDRVREHDWFAADRRDEVERWIERCQKLMNGFVEEVCKRQDTDAGAQAGGAEFDEVAQALLDTPSIPRLPVGRRKPPTATTATASD